VHKKGRTVFLYVFLYGAVRFVMEFFRGDDRGAQLWIFSQGQVISLLLIAVSITAYYFSIKQAKSES